MVIVTENERDTSVFDANYKRVLLLKTEPPLADNTPLSEEEVVLQKVKDSYCRKVAAQVGLSNAEFTIDKKGQLIRNSLVGEAKQIFVPSPLRKLILHLYQYPPVAKHPGQCRKYDTI